MVLVMSVVACAWVAFAFYVVIEDFFDAKGFQSMGLASWVGGTYAPEPPKKAFAAAGGR